MAVKPQDLLEQIDSGSPPVVVDVRSRWEVGLGRIPGAVHVPFWSVLARRAELPEDGGEPMVVYCGHGPRAWLARLLLRSMGYRDVRLLSGHWTGWISAGMPVEE